MTEDDRQFTPWFRIERRGNEYAVVVWKHKQSPERVQGTDIYVNPRDTLDALAQTLIKELISWE